MFLVDRGIAGIIESTMTIKEKTLENHFLVAMPSLADPNFSKSVVFIYEHNDKGALGMTINKPLQINLGNVLEHLGIAISKQSVSTLPVLMGGPVGQEHGFILYPNTVDDKEEVMISASKEMLQEIANGKGPDDFLITLGYSGWGDGQLESEIARNDWIVVPAAAKILFDTPITERWVKAAEIIGLDINKLSTQVGHG